MRVSRRLCFVALFSLTLGVGLTAAPGQAPGQAGAPSQALSPGANPDSALAVTLSGIAGAPLTLSDAFRLAGENATSLRDAEAALEGARASVRRERGGFDPEIFARGTIASDDSPTSSFFSGADVLKTEETSIEGGARVRLPLGTELEASLNTTRAKTNSSFASLDPQVNTFGQLTLRQPLLAGFGPAARQGLTAAERALAAAEARERDARLALEADVAAAYWDVYAAERDLAVRLLLRDQARSLLTDAQTRATAGLVGPNQPANARVFLAEQEIGALDAEERLDRLSDALASLIGERPAGNSPRFRPLDEPPVDYTTPPVDEVVAAAIENNYEIQARRATVEQVQGLAGAAKWNALPTLDVVGALGGNGLSGTGRDVIFGADTLRTNVRGGFSDTGPDAAPYQPGAWGSNSPSPSGSARGEASATVCAAT
jgi:outer membrane protein TolC